MFAVREGCFSLSFTRGLLIRFFWIAEYVRTLLYYIKVGRLHAASPLQFCQITPFILVRRKIFLPHGCSISSSLYHRVNIYFVNTSRWGVFLRHFLRCGLWLNMSSFLYLDDIFRAEIINASFHIWLDDIFRPISNKWGTFFLPLPNSSRIRYNMRLEMKEITSKLKCRRKYKPGREFKIILA